jgi:hypothetical protein
MLLYASSPIHICIEHGFQTQHLFCMLHHHLLCGVNDLIDPLNVNMIHIIKPFQE